MSNPSRSRMDPSIWSAPLRGQTSLSAAELAAAAGITPMRLAELVELGVVEPSAPGASWFTAASAARLRRILRLHADLDVDLADAAIIVELLERLDRLEAELGVLRHPPPHDQG
jgi:MerR-like DNA binding protein